ncbi:SDR family NAD(P)-dependent oxidoreductase [Pseudovibrio sp. Ad26]|uniref:SDR family NAD(P)-dependent oxidoreductase n=1 Tax=Pseudovibrio sp. Ad26 TaxID=989410 RepID=UPI0007AE8FF2|nr:SDR family NAD(P)-dependent oxidoreductase [Pseudovibrio sp. Ad26]KZK98327.1 short chain dehydrogenase [Pseudovibrio sp. Ad26]
MSPIRSVLITGANTGLGREAARQLAKTSSIEKIYLACRNVAKARAAKAALEAEAKRDIFEIILMDVMDPDSVRQAISQMTAPVDALILNAGGVGGRSPNGMTAHGVTNIYAVNLLGHVVLVDEMLERQLITSTVLYAGSEAARGIPKMGVARPVLKEASVDEFRAIADGRTFTEKSDPMDAYASVKLIGALWMSSMARQHPHIRFVTMSPGGTTGTNGFDDMPFLKRIFFKHVGGVLMPLLGMMHGVEDGAKRYVDCILDPKFKSGVFYASAGEGAVGKLTDQATLYSAFSNHSFQDNANQAVHQLV